jgi:hypothetical protein
VLGGFVLSAPHPAFAGAKLELGPDASADLSFTLQGHALLAPEPETENNILVPDFRVRRARLRLDTKVTDRFGARLQTDLGDGDGDGGSGIDLRLIDAYFTANAGGLLQLRGGLHLAPAARQHLAQSSTLLTFDRPGIVFKSLTWGTRGMAQFGNATMAATDAGIRGPVAVRDLGLTLHGDVSLRKDIHVKYFMGVYDGVRPEGSLDARVTGRVQLNFGEAEYGYFVAGSYLGKKRTVGVGLSADTQPGVGVRADGTTFGYRSITADVFAEQPVGGHPVTAELGYVRLDLGGGAPHAEGSGAFAQTSILLGKLQPWLGYEQWVANDARGDFSSIRAGFTYFVLGHRANVKLGYEHMLARGGVLVPSRHGLGTVGLGVFLNY